MLNAHIKTKRHDRTRLFKRLVPIIFFSFNLNWPKRTKRPFVNLNISNFSMLLLKKIETILPEIMYKKYYWSYITKSNKILSIKHSIRLSIKILNVLEFIISSNMNLTRIAVRFLSRRSPTNVCRT